MPARDLYPADAPAVAPRTARLGEDYDAWVVDTCSESSCSTRPEPSKNAQSAVLHCATDRPTAISDAGDTIHTVSENRIDHDVVVDAGGRLANVDFAVCITPGIAHLLYSVAQAELAGAFFESGPRACFRFADGAEIPIEQY